MKVSKATIVELKRAHEMILATSEILRRVGNHGDFTGRGAREAKVSLLNIDNSLYGHLSEISRIIVSSKPFKH